ncbi:hypothetical protein AVEN_172103-1 [Araneus ventricosus]|uniref:Uncharacterized protein n=1 Tax=Araneus ventricosus TaxID=182803 RepID=A0A4Y2T1Z3_ARAVE|nr:hypothetical protein AVEN_172103-1 [Araneus ventricosus]
MTRFLKLVRHEDGKWKALPTETDDLAQVSLKERLYQPSFFGGCDGTIVNTGVFNGVILRLELKLHRPIQWIICFISTSCHYDSYLNASLLVPYLTSEKLDET